MSGHRRRFPAHACGSMWRAGRRRIARARGRRQLTGPRSGGRVRAMPVVRANGLDIHYRIDGDGPETLLLINGVGDDMEGWGLQRDELAAAGLRVVTFDNRGCGTSSHPPGPYTSAQMAADARALVRGLGLVPLHLCGVSMGGCIALEYAARWPQDLLSVVLASTYAVSDPLTQAAFQSWADVALAAGMPVMMRQQAPWVFGSEFYATQPGTLT